MSSEYYRGYTAGRMAVQPRWISVKERLPSRDGHYYTITESQRGYPGNPIGTIAVDTNEEWRHGRWRQNDRFWKVLYWAEPLRMELPEELMNRNRA